MMVRFIIALCLASVCRLWTEALGIWSALRTRSAVAAQLRQARLNACAGCPIYFRLLRTCGSPLSLTKLGRQGCYCQMEVKAGTLANCWGYDNGAPFGWAKELNSFP